MASSKKIKILTILNIGLSIVCIVFTGCIAFFYWNEMISMKRQLDMLKEQFTMQSLKLDRPQTSPLAYHSPPLQSNGMRHYIDDSYKGDPYLNPLRTMNDDLRINKLNTESTIKSSVKESFPLSDLSTTMKGMKYKK
jgi:hypothetical protein